VSTALLGQERRLSTAHRLRGKLSRRRNQVPNPASFSALRRLLPVWEVEVEVDDLAVLLNQRDSVAMGRRQLEKKIALLSHDTASAGNRGR
jgi:hypothetical protein